MYSRSLVRALLWFGCGCLLCHVPQFTACQLAIGDRLEKDRQSRILKCEDPALIRMPEVKTGHRIAVARHVA